MARRGRAPKPKKEHQNPEWQRMLTVEKLVDEVVADHHPHLARAKIVVLGRPTASKRHDKVVAARARRAPRAVQALWKDLDGGDVHYMIEIGRDAWEKLDAKARRILIDHELCHFLGLDEKGRWAMRDHDIQEFTEIVKRYGTYHHELETFARAAQQLSLVESKA